ncbi:hypothetical protein QTP88_017277 [Uroleucon formosanum]
MQGNLNEAPKQIIVTESNETDISEKNGGDVEALQHMFTISEEKHIVKPDQQSVRKLRLAQRDLRKDNVVNITTLRLSELLEKALTNVSMTDCTTTGFRQSITVEIEPELQQQVTKYDLQRDIVIPENPPAVLPAVICSLQTDDDVGFDEDDWPKVATAIRRRRLSYRL